MKKGVSPVIAAVFIIITVITLAGLYTVFTGQLATQQTETGEQQSEELTTDVVSQVRIEAVDGREVEVRNIGRVTIPEGSLSVSVENFNINYTMQGDLPPENKTRIGLQELWKAGPGTKTLRVQSGSFRDSIQIRVKPVSGVVGDWRFEEGKGTTATDSSGNEHDGILHDHDSTNGDGTTPPQWVEGRVGGALEFDGSDDYVGEMDLNPEITDSITVSAWVKSKSFSATNYQGIVTEKYAPDSVDVLFELWYDGSADYYEGGFHKSGSWYSVQGDTTTKTGQWVHLTTTYDGSEMKIYRNGQHEGTTASSTGLPNGDLAWEIGRRHDGYSTSGNYWNGVIDEVLIYNRALNPSELYVMEPA